MKNIKSKLILIGATIAVILLGVVLNQQVYAEITPAIADIKANPSSIIEGSSNPVKFTAFITSVYGVDSARLEIIDNQTGETVDKLSFYDDGSHGDEIAGDEIFTQTKDISLLPPGIYGLRVIAIIPVVWTTGTEFVPIGLKVEERPTEPELFYTLTVESSPITDISITGDSANYGGITNYKRINIKPGTEIELIAPEEYFILDKPVLFSHWEGCQSVNGAVNQICHILIDTDRAVTAHYNGEISTFRVQSIIDDLLSPGIQTEWIEGEKTQGVTPYEVTIIGDTYTILEAPEEYGEAEFSYWEGCADDPTPRQCKILFSKGEAKTITAYYTTIVSKPQVAFWGSPKPTYTLSVDSSPVTSIYVDSGTKSYTGYTKYTKSLSPNTIVYLTAIPSHVAGGAWGTKKTAYSFVRWEGCNGGVSGEGGRICKINMNGNKTVKAIYKETNLCRLDIKTHRWGEGSMGWGVPIQTNPSIYGGLAPYSKDFACGAKIVILPPVSVYNKCGGVGSVCKYSFEYWEGCSSVSGNNNCTVTVDSDKTVTAVYLVETPNLITIENNGDSAEKFDLFFMGYGFGTNAQLEDTVKGLIYNSEGLFDTEPFKSNRTKFNIWAHRTDVYGIEDSEALQIEADLLFSNYDTLTYVGNHDFRSYAYFPYAELGGKGKVFLSVGPLYGLGELPRRTLCHEMGHAFGWIRDEYVESGKPKAPGYPNCAGSMSEAEMWWGDLVGSEYYACSIAGIPIMHEVGSYEGCSYVSANIRPHKHTIMKSGDVGCGRRVFGLVSDSQLCHLLGSPTTEYCSQIPELPPLPSHTLSVESSPIQNIPITSTSNHEGETPYTITDIPLNTWIVLTAPCTYGTSEGLCKYVSGGITYTFSGWSGCLSTSPWLTTLMFKMEQEEVQKECTGSSCYATCTANYEAE